MFFTNLGGGLGGCATPPSPNNNLFCFSYLLCVTLKCLLLATWSAYAGGAALNDGRTLQPWKLMGWRVFSSSSMSLICRWLPSDICLGLTKNRRDRKPTSQFWWTILRFSIYFQYLFIYFSGYFYCAFFFSLLLYDSLTCASTVCCSERRCTLCKTWLFLKG